MTRQDPAAVAGRPLQRLSLFDGVCLIVGIIVGAGIYTASPTVARAAGSPLGVMGVWLAGGLLALAGALCYAELSSCYPEEGGDYVYLRRAFGRCIGFLFGWSQLAVVRPADIAIMAFVFAEYAQAVYPLGPGPVGLRIYAATAVALLTCVNVLGVKHGKLTQNILTSAKVIGLVAVIGIGLAARGGQAQMVTGDPASRAIPLALIFVLFAFGGWNEMAYVAAEVKDPSRNIVRALVIGTCLVTGLYLLVNLAFLNALGFGGFARSEAVAVETVSTLMPRAAAKVVAVLICVSALGAVNGLVFTGARITYALGLGHRAFGILGRWHPGLGTPVTALLIQGLLSLGIALAAGSFYHTILYTAPLVWLFFLGTGASVLVLRAREGGRPRPYRVIGYPATPFIFCLCCLFMLYNCLKYALAERSWAVVLLIGTLAVGLAVYLFTERPRRP